MDFQKQTGPVTRSKVHSQEHNCPECPEEQSYPQLPTRFILTSALINSAKEAFHAGVSRFVLVRNISRQSFLKYADRSKHPIRLSLENGTVFGMELASHPHSGAAAAISAELTTQLGRHVCSRAEVSLNFPRFKYQTIPLFQSPSPSKCHRARIFFSPNTTIRILSRLNLVHDKCR